MFLENDTLFRDWRMLAGGDCSAVGPRPIFRAAGYACPAPLMDGPPGQALTAAYFGDWAHSQPPPVWLDGLNEGAWYFRFRGKGTPKVSLKMEAIFPTRKQAHQIRHHRLRVHSIEPWITR